MKVLRLLPVLAFLLLATPVMAQLDTRFLGNQPDMRAEPEFPRPGEEVTVSLSVPSSKISNADLVWSLNGRVLESMSNQRRITFVSGPIGSVDQVVATARHPSGRVEEYAMNVRATYIDIVLEPQTRVPDFYRGRALPSVGSKVNATVLVNNGQIVGGNDLKYLWRLNNTVLSGGPIRGSNKVSFDTPRGSQATLSIEVSDTQGNVYGRKAIYFDSEKPEVFFYENHPLYGRSLNAIRRSFVLLDSAATVVAEPYNLDINTYNSPDIIEWEIDGVLQQNANNPYQTTIKKVEEEGRAEVSFHVRSTSELLQGSGRTINVSF